MLGTFPDPYPDELLYSVFARYADRLGYHHWTDVQSDLFGSRHVIATVPFSSHLERLSRRLPQDCQYSADQLLTDHTLFGLYAPFLPKDRALRLKADLLSTRGSVSHGRAGIRASTVPSPVWLRYCPGCFRDDRQRHGQPYWHRIHQAPGVSVCHIHQCWLERSHIRAHGAQSRHTYRSAEQSLVCPAPERSLRCLPAHQSLLAIARAFSWLLHQRPTPVPGLDSLNTAYRAALSEADFVTGHGYVRVSSLHTMLVERFSSALLRLLHCTLPEDTSESWLTRLLRRPNDAHHPLHHLLLQQALGLTIEDLLSGGPRSAGSPPFGEGPWTCLNRASFHYGQTVVDSCKVTLATGRGGRATGTFTCSCGMVYTCTNRRGPAADRTRQVRIKTYGPLWESTLQRLWADQARSINEIARLLDVDPLTVKRHAARLNLPLVRTGTTGTQRLTLTHPLRPSRTKSIPAEELLWRRRRWMMVPEAAHAATRTQLRRRDPATYAWLYRHDRVWLMKQLPPSSLPKKGGGSTCTRINWERRDRALVMDIERVIPRLLQPYMDGKLKRISIARIGRGVGRLDVIQQHLDKLPGTAATLAHYVESREMFALRRISWACETFHVDGIQPRRWELVRRAGVDRLCHIATIAEAVDRALRIN